MPETETTAQRQPLQFDSDKGASRSRWVAGALTLALVGWMGSGFIIPANEAAPTENVTEKPRAVTVAVRQSTAQDVTQYFRAEGQAQPDRETAVLAEMSGDIAEVLVSKGAMVEANQVLARFDEATRQADLRRAEEERDRAQREFDNAQKLLEEGVATVDRVTEARAELAAAEAAVTSAEQALTETEIRAPFAGRLEALGVDAGEFVQAGVEVGRVVDARPLTVDIQVPQQAVSRLEAGQSATVKFITGEKREGKVTFVGSSADATTRTFLAEITVPNDDGAVPAGVSAEVRIPTGEVTAHFLSPAVLSLNAEGTLGVKIVGPDKRVVFTPVTIERAQTDGVHVSGLAETAQIITVGQGYVSDGELVDPQPEEEVGIEATEGPPTLAEAER